MSRDRFVSTLLKAGIVGVVGPNGGGKDLLIARLALASLDAGRPLLANHEVDHPLATTMQSLSDIMEWDGDMWLSEITTVAGSREASSLPVQVQARVQQLRKGGNGSRLWWSAPSYQRADLCLREVSQVIVKTTGHLPERQVAGGHIWAPRRLFRVKAYDAKDLVDFSLAKTSSDTQKQHRITPIAKDWYWRPGKPHQSLYKTLAAVEYVGFKGSGTCLRCGGRVVQPACNGHDEHGEALPRERKSRRVAA